MCCDGNVLELDHSDGYTTKHYFEFYLKIKKKWP